MKMSYKQPVPENKPNMAPLRPEDGPQDDEELVSYADYDEAIGGVR